MKKRPGPKGTEWTAEMDAVLGTMTDREAAQKLGLCLETVRRRRLAMAVPTHKSRRGDARRVQMLEMRSREMTYAEIGEHFEISRQRAHDICKG